jgi:hypothetical protein
MFSWRIDSKRGAQLAGTAFVVLSLLAMMLCFGTSVLVTIANVLIGLAIGYLVGSLLESCLHEYVSDAPTQLVDRWRKYPRLFRIMLNSYFSHHVIHHHQTFRKNHVTQFESADDRARLERLLLARGRHGRMIIGGDYANRLHAEGGFVFALPALICGMIISLFAPVSIAVGAVVALMLAPLLSYFVHPYLHRPFIDGQRDASSFVAFLLRTRYMKAVYRNHFIHHRYGGTSNYNLVLGADFIRNRVRKPAPEDVAAMKQVGMPLD